MFVGSHLITLEIIHVSELILKWIKKIIPYDFLLQKHYNKLINLITQLWNERQIKNYTYMAFTNIYNYLKRLSEGHFHGKLRNSTILENNRKEREKDIRKEQRRLLLYSFVNRVASFLDELVRFLIVNQ